jgi:hypothetical protein
MDRLEAAAPTLYVLVLLLIALVGVLIVGMAIFGVWKVFEYERRRKLRTRFDSDEQEMEAPMVAV